MKLWPLGTRRIAPLMAIALSGILAAPAFAQDQAPPPSQTPVMQNVFFNVVWGSALGATLGLAAAAESSSNKTKPVNAQGSMFEGATIGGILGLGIGVWLVYAGITFDPAGSTIFSQDDRTADPVAYAPKDLRPSPAEGQRPSFDSATTPAPLTFSLETAPGQPGKITGFRAQVVGLRF